MDLDELKLTDKRKSICERLNLNNSDDILSYYPFRYEMFNEVHYCDFKENNDVCFKGELISSPSTFRKGRLAMTRFKVLYEEEVILVTIFNRPWVNNVRSNETITIIGKYMGNNKVTAANYFTKNVIGEIIPYYPLKDGISQNEIRKLIDFTLKKCENELKDILPSDLISEHHLIDYLSAIRNIHNPSSSELLKKSLSRLKYEEFLRFYLSLEILKGNTTSAVKKKKEFSRERINELIDSLGFDLTDDQKKTVDDILSDLSSEKVMYRLVQGEVGSGKTAVAMIGLYANYLAGYQGALMAPTEILAKQHYQSLKEILEPFGVRIGVLYSSMDKEKEIKKNIENGDLDIIVGTHALFSKDVEYRNLGMVIADEQHRFGVRQRQALKEKGQNVDFILMSATPIPRTLASSIYGDMDVSTIETLPTGRKGCRTYLIKKNSIGNIMDEIRRKLDEGRQIYIIAAAIDKSDNYNAKDVNGLYEALKEEFSPYKVALLHSRLSTEEKDEIMESFNKNEFQIMISTTVIEVGVNVKNATMMIIYDADKFGLSQIHQLRGRVQRSDYEGVCYLLTNSSDEYVLKRLDILCKSNDGFEISYEDLKLRGPGDILGTRQSGIPAFILGNLIEDTRFINAAKEDAHRIINNLDLSEYRIYYDKIYQNASKNFVS